MGRIAAARQDLPGRWRHRFALFTSAATLFLIFAGGMVTSTGSGLAVPDWPLSYGEFFPPMVGGIFYEHGHRMVAGTVGLLMIGLAIWTWLREGRRWVRWLAAGAVLAVITQAVLGGITVLFLLPTAVSVSHAGLANLFFMITVVLAVVTGPWWIRAPGRGDPTAFSVRPDLPALAGATTLAIYIQILLGAVMRHTDSGLAIPDFPLAFGRLIPPMTDPHVAIHFAHRVGALLVVLMVGWVVARTLRRHRGDGGLVGPALLVGCLAIAQIVLGAFTVWTGKAATLTTFHVAGGSATLAAGLILTLRATRLHSRAARGARVHDLAPVEGPA